MHRALRTTLAAAAVLLPFTIAHAIPQTRISPTGGALPAAVTEIGGIVLDLTGTSGTRLVAQLPASTLFVGNTPSSPASIVIGTQTGFTAAQLTSLGGSFSAASIRVTLFDGDQATGNFDFNNNTFLVDGVSIGNWSTPTTYRTDSTGTTLISTHTGFPNNLLATGFFSSTDATFLASLATNIADGTLVYRLSDTDPGDQFFDFRQGVDGGLIDVGTPPVVVPPVNPIPEPETYALMALGLGAISFVARRKRARKSA